MGSNSEGRYGYFERKRQMAKDVDDAVALYFIGNS